MVLCWLCATRNIEPSPHPDDGSLVKGHAQVHARNAMGVEIARSEYSYLPDEIHKVRDAWIGHRVFTKHRGICTTPDIL